MSGAMPRDQRVRCQAGRQCQAQLAEHPVEAGVPADSTMAGGETDERALREEQSKGGMEASRQL